MTTRLTPIAFDIETTGFETAHRVTVVGLVLPLGCRVFLQTDGRSADADGLEERLASTFGTTIRLSSHSAEADLLDGFATFVRESVSPQEYMLVAYNGERFRGGFDLPFLRTRYARSGLAWPFEDVPYADLMPIFQHRFNTTVDGEPRSDLAGVYGALVGDGMNERDPFETSEAAVSAFENGEFEALLAHNVADILRTEALAGFAERYCSKSEFDLKSLTPTSRDPSLDS